MHGSEGAAARQRAAATRQDAQVVYRDLADYDRAFGLDDHTDGGGEESAMDEAV